MSIENRLTGLTHDCGIQHERFAALLKRVEVALHAAKMGKFLNIWLVGPAGSGKTTACEHVALALQKALSIPFEFQFNGAIDTEYKLLGFIDANSRLIRTPFREAWENGGLYLFDELDASMPSACLALNAALANGYCDFPDGKVVRHPNCVIIAAGNVWGGPTELYVGRYTPDAAFANRFIKFAWNYDEKFERHLAVGCVSAENASLANRWVSYVQGVRKNVAAKGVKIVVSPRASIFGALMLDGGISWEETVEETIRQGMVEATWKEIAAVA